VLYFVVFGWALGPRLATVEGVPYARFIVPGLVTLGVVSNAFLNTASSLFIMKIQGTLVDLLVTPLSHLEVLLGFVGAAVVRALLVGGLTWLVASAFVGFHVAHPLAALVLVLLIAVAFAGFGLMAAVWSEKFEQVNFVPTFVITPLTFLGGVFYSVKVLPPALAAVTALNPIFYLVDVMRWSVVGMSDAPPLLGAAVLLALVVVGNGGAWLMLATGYKLRG
jgi:ABC-2 type transport system permease protein